MSGENNQSLIIQVLREPYIELFTLVFENGESEELEPEEARDFFKKIGADMYEVERALDYCWNFYNVTIVVDNPKPFDLKNTKMN